MSWIKPSSKLNKEPNREQKLYVELQIALNILKLMEKNCESACGKNETISLCQS